MIKVKNLSLLNYKLQPIQSNIPVGTTGSVSGATATSKKCFTTGGCNLPMGEIGKVVTKSYRRRKHLINHVFQTLKHFYGRSLQSSS